MYFGLGRFMARSSSRRTGDCTTVDTASTQYPVSCIRNPPRLAVVVTGADGAIQYRSTGAQGIIYSATSTLPGTRDSYVVLYSSNKATVQYLFFKSEIG